MACSVTVTHKALTLVFQVRILTGQPERRYMNNILFSILNFFIRTFWKSKWGLAITLSTWEEYRNSPLFEERMKYFGSIEAAKLFSWSEFKFFKNKVLKNKERISEIIWFPGRIVKRVGDRDISIRKLVSFEGS